MSEFAGVVVEEEDSVALRDEVTGKAAADTSCGAGDEIVLWHDWGDLR